MGTKSLLVSSLFLIALLAVCRYTPADEPKKSATPVFKRYVGILYKGNQKQVVLQNAEVKVLGERSFLVGTPVGFNVGAAPALGEARKGNLRWIAVSEIVDFYEFDDEKGFNGSFPEYDR